jgi:hypothetical protein
MKADKAPGVDGIPPGLLKLLSDEWLILLTFVFNAVFNGTYPTCWDSARMINIFKKGDRMQPQNYRGISIMSAMAKLYDMVLAERFILWYKPREEQAGAQKGRSCDEQILTIRLLIDVARKQKTPLFLCFIDFEKAYDRVSRYQLMKRLDEKGCGTKYLNALQQSYSRTKGQIGNQCFTANAGVRQGACTSCPLFTCIVDSIIESVDRFGEDAWLGKMHMLLLMDDTVVMATSRIALTTKLALAHQSLTEIGMRVNATKSNFITVGTDDRAPFHMGDAVIEYTEKYKYLGAWISNANVSDQMKMHITSKRPQTLKFAAFLHKNPGAPYPVKRTVWQAALLASVMYSCDTWLCADLRAAESVYNSTLKQMLGVRETTCNDLTLVEAGERGAKQFIRQQQKNLILRMQARDNYERSCYHRVIEMAMTTRSPMGKVLEAITSATPTEDPLVTLQQVVRDSASTRRVAYRNLNPSLVRHPAYTDDIQEHHRVAFTRIRLSSHHLMYERGRWSRIPPDERLCPCGDTQSDKHVLLTCPLTENARLNHRLNYNDVNTLMNDDASEISKFCFQVLKTFE